MEITLLVLVAILAIATIALGFLTLARTAKQSHAAERIERAIDNVLTHFEMLKAQGIDVERDLKQDLAIARNEHANAAQTLRIEVGERLTQFTQLTQQQFHAHTSVQAEQMKAFGERLAQLQQAVQAQLAGASSA